MLGLLVFLIPAAALAWYFAAQDDMTREGVRALAAAGDPVALDAASTGAFLGFEVDNATVPKDEIRRGGPPKDGIPAILEPKFVEPAQAEFLEADDEVLGFVHEGEAKAYPLRILVWHEVVNDTVGGKPIIATYCPLCGTCMVFSREVEGKKLTFGVSGLLYNSDVLMYDHQTESLWSQLKSEAVAGEYAGTQLPWLSSQQMTWAAWQEAYPDSRVLSSDTGYRRDYGATPYAGYEDNERTMFPVPDNRSDLSNKTWVAGIVAGGQAKAYPRDVLDAWDGPQADEVGGIPLEVAYDADARHAVVTRTDTGEQIPVVWVFWFAWQAFYPETELAEADQ
jgi:hypothetical protein